MTRLGHSVDTPRERRAARESVVRLVAEGAGDDVIGREAAIKKENPAKLGARR